MLPAIPIISSRQQKFRAIEDRLDLTEQNLREAIEAIQRLEQEIKFLLRPKIVQLEYLDETRQRQRETMELPKESIPPEWNIIESELLERMQESIVENSGHVYLCIHDILPESLFNACLAHWPEPNEFDQMCETRFRVLADDLIKSPVSDDAYMFWDYFSREVVNGIIKPCLATVFMPHLERKFDFLPPDRVAEARENMEFQSDTNEGLLLDRNFTIRPHIDNPNNLGSGLINLMQFRLARTFRLQGDKRKDMPEHIRALSPRQTARPRRTRRASPFSPWRALERLENRGVSCASPPTPRRKPLTRNG